MMPLNWRLPQTQIQLDMFFFSVANRQGECHHKSAPLKKYHLLFFCPSFYSTQYNEDELANWPVQHQP